MASSALKFLFGEDNAVSAALDGFKFTDIVKKIGDFVEDGLKSIGKTIGKAIDTAVEWAKNLISWEELKKDILSDGLFPAIGARLAVFFKGFTDWFDEKVQAVTAWWDGFKEKLPTLEDITGWLQVPIDKVSGALKAIGTFLSDTWESIKEKMPTLEDITGWLMTPINFVVDGVESLGTSLSSLWTTIQEKLPTLEDITGWLMIPVNAMIDGIKGIGAVITAAADWLIELFSWENIKAGITGIGDVLASAANGLLNLVKDGLAWMANKLKFWDSSTDEEKEEKRVEKEQKKAAKQEKKDKKKFEKEMKSSGVIDKVDTTFGFGGREVISEDKMKDLTNAQLEGLLDYSADTGNLEMQEQLLEEGSRRAELKKDHTGFEHWSDAALGDVINKQQSGQAGEILGTPEVAAKAMQEWEKRESVWTADSPSSGNLESAVQPQTVNEIDEKYANPAKIAGLGQESIARTQEMQVSQASYDQNRGPLQSQGNVNTSVSAPTTNNTSINNSYSQTSQPSTTDNSDQLYIFRATGTSR